MKLKVSKHDLPELLELLLEVVRGDHVDDESDLLLRILVALGLLDHFPTFSDQLLPQDVSLLLLERVLLFLLSVLPTSLLVPVEPVLAFSARRFVVLFPSVASVFSLVSGLPILLLGVPRGVLSFHELLLLHGVVRALPVNLIVPECVGAGCLSTKDQSFELLEECRPLSRVLTDSGKQCLYLRDIFVRNL